jgi:D-alanyl-D-alanine carboxypeptidase (penicillin-binding protein 5/6)
MNKNINFLIIALILSSLYFLGINISQVNFENFLYAQISSPLQGIALVESPPKPQKPELELDVKSGMSLKINKAGREKVIFRKDSLKALPIASLTKLMTALVVLENSDLNNYNFSNIITVSEKAASQEDVPVHGNLKAGDSLTIKKNLELMLIYSSNDAAFALSEVIGTEIFVERMNQKAYSLELKNTHFTNPTGLDPDEDPGLIPNYSSSQDLVNLSKYILENYPLMFEITLEKGPYPTQNGISNLYPAENQEFIGGKTGYTDIAGGCMLSVVKDEKENKYINVILGAESSETRVQEMQKLINWLSL